MREMIKRKEWLGDIPSKWGYIPGKYAFKLRTSKGNSTPILLAATQKQGMYPQHLLEGVVQVQEGTDMQTFKTVHINDYVISLRSFQGGFEMSDYEGVCSPAYQVFYNTKPIDHRYFKYLFKCKGFIQEMDSVTVGIREGKNIPYNSFGQTYIPFPSLPEQSRIAAFLDERCGKIDEAIAKHKALIEKLDEYRKAVITKAVIKGVKGEREMKESGVDWIGQIPSKWSVKRGKFFLTLLNRPTVESDGVITCFRDGEVTLRSRRREEGFTFAIQEAGYQGIEPGDLVIHKMDGFAGAVGVSDSRGKGTPALNVLDSNENKDYLKYYFRAVAFLGYFESVATGIRVRTCDTGWPKIQQTPCLLPPQKEQSEIVAYLDKKCASIDSAKERHTQLIAKLEEYKKSLIYNAVTGKIEC